MAQICRAISSQLRHVLTIGKKLLNSNTSSTCPHNMVNFGPLSAKIRWRVWGTPVNFNWFRVLAALLHGTLAVGVSQTAALNRGRHLYSAGRPSRWALAHISSCYLHCSILTSIPDPLLRRGLSIFLRAPRKRQTLSMILTNRWEIGHNILIGCGGHAVCGGRYRDHTFC